VGFQGAGFEQWWDFPGSDGARSVAHWPTGDERGLDDMTAVVERLQTGWGSTVQFIREVRVELKKVTWPQRNEIIGSTAVVIVASFVVAFFLGFVDLVLQKALGLIIK
jgi:preprotein translocase SecE subunit